MSAAGRERGLLEVLDGLYRGLGEAAPRAGEDAAAVALYEAARTVGAATLAWRERLGDEPAAPLAAIVETFEAAAGLDPSGRLGLAVATSLVGPRVLVSLRDLREEPGEDPLDDGGRSASATASDAVVAAIWRCARAAGALAREGEGPDGFAELARRLDDDGYGESFR
ncbi:MAG TPA: hypothetical protein PLS29_08085 [Acidimicrobiales bacterium]|nr:MAG: hypothetical protein B7Z69_04870 [Actinobacteria bacterium 21-73-9]HQU26972.1 hypothetical protein [Acidimicrobiales bacterium]